MYLKNLQRTNKLSFACLLLILLLGTSLTVFSQCPQKEIKRVLLVKTARNVVVTLDLSVNLKTTPPLPKDQVIVITKPSNTSFTGEQLRFVTVTPAPNFLRVELNEDIPPDDTEVEVILNRFDFDCEGNGNVTRINSVKASGKIYGKDNIDELVAESKKRLEDAAAHAKTSDEKDIFAGFAVASGQDGETAGVGDLSFNKTVYNSDFKKGTFFDKATVSLDIKKSTAEKADLKYFTSGITFRKTFLVGQRNTIKSLQTPIESPAFLDSNSITEFERNLNTRNEEITALRNKGFFRVLLIDETLNLEGEAFNFDAVNFVSDTKIQLASIAKAIGKGRNGYYNVRLFLGPEIGRNLQKPEAATTTGATQEELDKVDWIARLKTGGILTLRYLPSDDLGSSWGIELDLQFVNRYLFSNEVIIKDKEEDDMTASERFLGTPMTTDNNKTVTVKKGNRAYGQADLKIFPFSDKKARYGFKLSYINGSLPPAFTPAKGFTFGLVIESKDDKSNEEPVNP